MTAIVFNVLACLVLTKPEENGPLKVKMGKTLKSIVKNPLIIASVLGFAASYAHLQLPGILQKPLENLGNMAAPMSLLCIGSSLDLTRVRKSFKYAVIAACVKTWGQALVVIPAAILLGFRGFELTVIHHLFYRRESLGQLCHGPGLGQ